MKRQFPGGGRRVAEQAQLHAEPAEGAEGLNEGNHQDGGFAEGELADHGRGKSGLGADDTAHAGDQRQNQAADNGCYQRVLEGQAGTNGRTGDDCCQAYTGACPD